LKQLFNKQQKYLAEKLAKDEAEKEVKAILIFLNGNFGVCRLKILELNKNSY